jgi:hypothetical protein
MLPWGSANSSSEPILEVLGILKKVTPENNNGPPGNLPNFVQMLLFK